MATAAKPHEQHPLIGVILHPRPFVVCREFVNFGFVPEGMRQLVSLTSRTPAKTCSTARATLARMSLQGGVTRV